MKTVMLPHPVLLPDSVDYKDGFKFEIVIDKEPQHTLDNQIILSVYFDLTSKFIRDLVRKNKAKICTVIKCTKTYSRKVVFINVDEKKELKLPQSEYFDKIRLSSYITATEPINEFRSDEHHEEFSSMSIPVPAGAILARASDKDLKIDSLDTLRAAIELVPRDTLKEGEYVVDVGEDLIKIYMHKDTRNRINALRSSNDRMLFSSIYMVALTYAIQNITEDGTKTWEEGLRKTLMASEKKINDELKKEAYKHAQKILKYPVNYLMEENSVG